MSCQRDVLNRGKNMTDNVKKFERARSTVAFGKAAAKVDIRAELSARLGDLPEEFGR